MSHCHVTSHLGMQDLLALAMALLLIHQNCIGQEQDFADLVLLDATVITVDDQMPNAEAFAVREGRFIAVGSSEAIRQHIGPDTQILKARGKTIVPGFNDAHIHPQPKFDEMSLLASVDCSPSSAATIEQLIERLRIKADRTPKGHWVRGSRYQDTKLGRHLTSDDLDQVSTEHPVYVSHSSGHLAACNSLALQLAGVDAETADPKGGSFERTAEGQPTGLLRESAKSIVLEAGPARPSPTMAEWIAGMQRRFQEYHSHGITSVQHAGISPNTLRKYEILLARDPQMRVYAMLRRGYVDALQQHIENHGRGNPWLRVGGVKMFHGNSLSGRTCWLYEPYADRSDYYGIPPAASQSQLNDRVLRIHQSGLQACIHANGDREIDMVLDAYAAALQAEPRSDHRHRIEHASVCNERILRRVKQLGVVLATHSYVWEHGDKMEAYGSQRWPWMHPNGSATEMGIPVAGNSDSPVSAARPLLRIQSMVTRTSAEGKVYGPEQCVTVEEALRIWTMGSAYASFEEDDKGSITPGKYADFVVLSADPRVVPAETIKEIQVELTAIGGRVVYSGNTQLAASHFPPQAKVGYKRVARLPAGPARENSGIVKSKNYEDVYWMHNDSGDEPRIYAIRQDGSSYRGDPHGNTAGTLIGGAINVDWEDIAVTEDGSLIVADVGNNDNDRRDLVLYVVDEPPPTTGRTTFRKKLFIRYPQQQSYPAPRTDFNYDCEAIFCLGDAVILLTKHRSDTATSVYRLTDFTPGEVHDLELLQRREMQGQVVAADISEDQKQIVVATYDAMWLFEVKDVNRPLDHPIKKLPYASDQVEAVAFAGSDAILFADEATAVLYRAKLDDFEPIAVQP